MTSRTIFARIIDREIPATIVYEDERVLAFKDINPVAPTHILIIPKKEIDMLENVDAGDVELLGHLLYAAKQIAAKEKLDGFRVVINNGESAGQTVFHLHVHLIGGRNLSWPPG